MKERKDGACDGQRSDIAAGARASSRRSRTELLRPIWRNAINRPLIPFAERHLHSLRQLRPSGRVASGDICTAWKSRNERTEEEAEERRRKLEYVAGAVGRARALRSRGDVLTAYMRACGCATHCGSPICTPPDIHTATPSCRKSQPRMSLARHCSTLPAIIAGRLARRFRVGLAHGGSEGLQDVGPFRRLQVRRREAFVQRQIDERDASRDVPAPRLRRRPRSPGGARGFTASPRAQSSAHVRSRLW